MTRQRKCDKAGHPLRTPPYFPTSRKPALTRKPALAALSESETTDTVAAPKPARKASTGKAATTKVTATKTSARKKAVAEAAPAEAPKDVAAAPVSLEALIAEKLDEDKAQDIVVIDLTGKSSVADSLIIASGRSQRHVGALADHLLRALKDHGFGKAKVEGLPACDWVLIDVGDVVVHLFRPEVRTFYNIEKIWSVSLDGTGHIISST